MMETIACNICGSTIDKELYHSEKFRVVICTVCTLIYLNPRMNQDGYTRYYADEYQHNRHAVTTYEEAIQRLERKKSYERKKQLLPFINEFISAQIKVLEIGSGWGTLLKLINDTYKCRVQGVEISSLAAEVSEKYYHIPTKQQTIEQFHLENGGKEKFDFIIMYHVLEHMLNPRSTLEMIQSMLTKGGALYIAVPNMAHPDEDLSRFFRIEHPYYFTIQTLAKLLKEAGYSIVKTITTSTDIQIIAMIYPVERGMKEQVIDKKYSVLHLQKVVYMHNLKEHIKSLLRPVKKFLRL